MTSGFEVSIEIGSAVTRHKVGDHVAVGCMVDSCQTCDQCRKGEEQLCRDGNTGTYGGLDRFTKDFLKSSLFLHKTEFGKSHI